MFIEANDVDIELSKEVGADAVEFHTGHYCTEMNKAKTTKTQWDLSSLSMMQLGKQKIWASKFTLGTD